MLWARKWITLAVLAVVLLTATGLSLRQTKIYASTATVLVEVPPGEQTAESPNMATEKRVASSTAVAQLVVQGLKLSTSAADLIRGLGTNVPVETELLQFTYSSPDPRMAEQLAQAFATAYLTFRRQEIVDEILASERSLESRIGVLTRELTKVDEGIQHERDSQQLATLHAEATSVITQIGILQEKLASLDPSQGVYPGRIVEPAPLPKGPARPNIPLNISLAVFLGLALGVGAAFAREYLDHRIRGPRDLETWLGAPVLSVIPTDRRIRQQPGAELITSLIPESITAESIRQLRTTLLFSAAQVDARTILVTSAHEKEGKTFVVANLGVTLAMAGKETILVSGDLRRAHLEQVFGLPSEPGLVDVLLGNASLSSVLQRVSVHRLAVLPAGPLPSNPAELLGSPSMAALLAELRERADYVLVDSTPLLPVADAAALVPACDATLVVAHGHSVTRAQIAKVSQQLDRFDATVLGAVLLHARNEESRLYQYR